MLGAATESGAVALVPMVLLSGFFGYKLAKRKDLPPSFFSRFWPLTTPALALVAFSIFYNITLLFGYNTPVHVLFGAGALIILAPYWAAFLVVSERQARSQGKILGAVMVLGLFAICGGAAWATHAWVRTQVIPTHAPYEPSVAHDGSGRYGHGIDERLYLPFGDPSKLASLGEEATVHISANWPRLDGSIALLPIYGAAAQAVYTGLDMKTVRPYVTCYNTAAGFDRLLADEVDIFFGPKLSPEQKVSAEERGLALTEVAIAKEAFVFLVHRDNPVNGLTVEQIRAVYGREITNWRALGGANERIMAFQRPDTSGSQAIMKMVVMKGARLARPVQEEFSVGMGDLIKEVAAYRNRLNALGYSFRWYATAQYPSPDIKLLAVNGVPPTVENIRNGTYPFVSEVMAVRARPLSPESRVFLDWLTGPQGQKLIQQVGYVPVSAD